MIFLLGSHFWKMNTDKSDKDYIEFVFPTREELYKGERVSINRKEEIAGELCDVSYKDIRNIIKETKKGSLVMFECMYSEPVDNLSIREIPVYEFIKANRDNIFEEVKYEFMKSLFGEAKSRIKKMKDELDGKQLAHLQKILWILTLTNNGLNPFHIMLNKTFTDKLLDTRLNPTEELFACIETGLEHLSSYDFSKFAREDKPVLDKLNEIIKTMVFV